MGKHGEVETGGGFVRLRPIVVNEVDCGRCDGQDVESRLLDTGFGQRTYEGGRRCNGRCMWART